LSRSLGRLENEGKCEGSTASARGKPCRSVENSHSSSRCGSFHPIFDAVHRLTSPYQELRSSLRKSRVIIPSTTRLFAHPQRHLPIPSQACRPSAMIIASRALNLAAPFRFAASMLGISSGFLYCRWVNGGIVQIAAASRRSIPGRGAGSNGRACSFCWSLA